MPKLQLRPEWILNPPNGGPRPLQGLVTLLTAVGEEKNLSAACRKVGLSYRHAWGLVRDASQVLGAPLLRSVRGQGATLSALGERIVWANKRVAARLSPLLESLSSELEAELRQVSANPTRALRVQASHAFALDALRDQVAEAKMPIELRYTGSAEALASLAQHGCDIAGFHTPIGDLESGVLEHYRKWLKPRTHVLINLVVRRQGILVAPGNPKRVAGLSDLVRPGVRFVNRQLGSGTRLLLDLMLQRERMDSRAIAGYDNAEFTHAAVAAYIASGMADAGIGVETAARRFGLAFVPLVQERYFLACHADALESRQIKALLENLRSREFRMRVAELPGIEAPSCGNVAPLTEVFPQLARKPR